MSEQVDTEIIHKFLLEASGIIKRSEEELDKDGTRFNIFSILDLTSNEVRLHSNLIAVLLNPKGTHSFGSSFLTLFIKNLQKTIKSEVLNKFNIYSAKVEIEKPIGFINDSYTSGGKLDIVIADKFDTRICIENKIYARDQKNQLLRYYNFDNDALLLYLTLEGKEPEPSSTANKLILNQHFFCISYKRFIHSWLRECIEIANAKPKVGSVISQYMNIIEDYTEQSIRHNMSKKIEDLISKNKEFYNSINEINISYNNLRMSVEQRFWNIIREKQPKDETICKISADTELRYCIAEDNEAFFYGFYILRNGSRIDCTNEEFKPIADILKEVNSNFFNNGTYLGWTNSNFVHLFRELDIFDLIDEKEMKKLTDGIIKEIIELIEAIRDRIV